MAGFDPLTAGLSIAEKVLTRIWPDPAQQAEAAQKLAELRQKGDLSFLNADVALLSGQIETNKLEAQHGGLFKGGWRPAVGWVCAAALAYKFLAYPAIVSGVQIAAHFMGEPLFPLEFLPEIEWQELSVILLGMLGLGGYRTWEKRKTAGD